MPIINCRECDANVSDSALRCPSCGFQLKRPTRGVFGRLFKWGFILFNLFMASALLMGLSGASEAMEGMSGVEKAGYAVGTGLGAGLILTAWLIGDVILGLFVLLTRPKL